MQALPGGRQEIRMFITIYDRVFLVRQQITLNGYPVCFIHVCVYTVRTAPPSTGDGGFAASFHADKLSHLNGSFKCIP